MRRALLLSLLCLGAAAGLVGAAGAQQAGFTDVAETRRALAEARRQGDAARARAERLEGEARAAGAAAERGAAEAAAAAARIQQAEAAVSAQQANIALIDRQREDLRARIAVRQRPLLRLTAGLQRLARRPLLFTLFRPGSVRDTAHLGALLSTMLPEVAERTASLRGELERSHALRARAEASVAALRKEQADLARRRTALAAMETRQRLAARQSAGVADREAERALALAEQARDLGALADDLGRAGRLSEELAALPGPVMRPPPGAAAGPPVLAADTAPAPRPSSAAVPVFLLPVQGRIVAGFGEARAGALRSRGVGIAAAAGAQAVSPAAGRIAFAGIYRGFGQIAIIDHGQGWTSLVTGLAVLGVGVGDMVVAGSPLGTAGPGHPVVTLELRRDGQPVNPLDFVRL